MFMIDRHRVEYAVLPILIGILHDREFSVADLSTQEDIKSQVLELRIRRLVLLLLEGLKEKHREKLERRLVKIQKAVYSFCERLQDKEIGFLMVVLLAKHFQLQGRLRVHQYPEYYEAFHDLDDMLEEAAKAINQFNEKWSEALNHSIEFLVDLHRQGYFCLNDNPE